MKPKKSTLLPIVLALYLALMAYIGYPSYKSGEFSPLYYFGSIAATLAIIIILHFVLKRRERLKEEREREMRNNS